MCALLKYSGLALSWLYAVQLILNREVGRSSVQQSVQEEWLLEFRYSVVTGCSQDWPLYPSFQDRGSNRKGASAEQV